MLAANAASGDTAKSPEAVGNLRTAVALPSFFSVRCSFAAELRDGLFHIAAFVLQDIWLAASVPCLM